ncbi:unnamed protein product, partial [Didymodactylos carnosus]
TDPQVLFLVGSRHEKTDYARHLSKKFPVIHVEHSPEKASLACEIKPFALHDKTGFDIGIKFHYIELLSLEIDQVSAKMMIVQSLLAEWCTLMCDLTHAIRRSYLFQEFIPMKLMFKQESDQIIEILDKIIEYLLTNDIAPLIRLYGSYTNTYHYTLSILKSNPFLRQFLLCDTFEK